MNDSAAHTSPSAQSPGERVLVAMSGGVDSSVVAALLHEQGYGVVGVFMRNGVKHAPGEAGKPNKQGCCSVADSMDAALVANRMGVPFYALNFEQEFRGIIEYFVDEYRVGRTPNPCVVCNNDLKFGKLLAYADDAGATRVATGHYAQSEFSDGRWQLMRGADSGKDQSYYLFGLTQEQLARCWFPLGAMTKAEVREHARRLELRTRDKPESQEICFVPDNDYRTVLKAYAPDAMREGQIVHEDGRVLGTHAGTATFTIGQRKGLNIGGLSDPLFVTALEPEADRVVVGPRSSLKRAEFLITRPNAVGLDLAALPLGEAVRARFQIRYRHRAAPGAMRRLVDGSLHVELDAPEEAITPGQACVVYDEASNTRVLCGGWIDLVGA